MLKTIQILAILLLTTFLGYGQTENYWVKKSDLGSDTTGNGLKRERAVAFTIDDFAYVGTGVDTAEHVLKDFWKYDPIANAWTQVADLPGSVRRNAVAFAIQGYGYVGTGVDSLTATTPGSQKMTDFWRYDATLNSWSQISNMPGAGRYFATGFAIDSKGYVCCGKFGPNNYSNQLYEYKPTTDTWTQLPSFPGGVRYQLSSFVIDYKAYVGLGTDQDMYRDDFWEFDATTNLWSPISPLPASERASAMTFSIGQRGFVCMGTNGGYLDDLWEYNPFTDDWTSRAKYGGTRRKNGVGFTLNGLGYVGSGKGYSGKKASFQEYHPVGVLGMDELDVAINIYPNPTQDQINIKSSSLLKEIIVKDNYGKEVLRTTNYQNINVHHLMPGIYFVSAVADNGTVQSNQKFIKL